MPVDAVHIAADGLVKQSQDAAARMLDRHRGERFGQIQD